MTVYIIGGSGSGKSEFAEKIAVSLNGERRVYIASMIPRGDEGKNKVIRHRTMRQNKGFITIENIWIWKRLIYMKMTVCLWSVCPICLPMKCLKITVRENMPSRI